MTYNRIFSVKNHFLPALLLFFLSLAACEDEPGCVSDNSSFVTISFFKIDDTTQRNVDDSNGISRFSAVGSSPDSAVTVSGLPLNPSENVATFYVSQENGQVDTIALSYQREQTLISPECGPSQRYFNLDTIRSTFDSIRIVDREVSNLNSPTKPNIEIYACPDTFYTDNIIVNFLERDTLVRRDTLFVQSIRDDRGQLLADKNDTIVGSLRVPVNPQVGGVTLTFDLLAHKGEPARTQTLTLAYEEEQLRLARQCRPETRYFDLDTVRSTFDSLHIENRELAVDVPLNIEIIDLLE